MAIPRMRTVAEAVAEIKAADAQSAITHNCVRTLCREGKINCIYAGRKVLVDLDALINYLSGNPNSFSEKVSDLA